MITNTNNRNVISGNLSKCLTTPFSINDILTRNNTTIIARSVGDMDMTSIESASFKNAKSLEKDSACVQNSELSVCRSTQETVLSGGSSFENKSRHNNSLEYFQYISSLDNNNQEEFVMHHIPCHHNPQNPKTMGSGTGFVSLGVPQKTQQSKFFGTNSLLYANGTRDCPIDMRRCAANDSGKLKSCFCLEN